MANDLDIPFDRITYRDGQLLTAQDLRDDTRHHDRLRRLHTRYLHETWGIGLGFTVHKAGGNKAVVVGPGYAADEAGRDILLAEGIHVSVPDVVGPETLVLIASYQEDAAFRARPDLASLCLGCGLDPRDERPIFSWQRPDDVRFGPHIPLVQISVGNGTIQGSLDFRVRRHARPLVRPHMGWGVTEPGRTGWRLWQENGQDNVGLEVVVNTSEAGFLRTPYYFALLRGDFAGVHFFELEVSPAGKDSAFFLGAFSFITDASSESFTYRIIQTEQASETEAEKRRWTVSWLGVEPVTGCEPALDLARLFTLSGVSILKAFLT